MTEKNLQSQMQQEMIDKKIFNQAKEYAFDYADKALERNVYPTDEALENLRVFDEQLPDTISNPLGILELLHTHGSPATVTQIGGRYFGLVNGGIFNLNGSLAGTNPENFLSNCYMYGKLAEL